MIADDSWSTRAEQALANSAALARQAHITATTTAAATASNRRAKLHLGKAIHILRSANIQS